MFYLKDQRGVALIAVLIVLALIATTAVFVSKNKTSEQKTTTVDLRVDGEASPSASPSLSPQPTQPPPKPKLTPKPTPVYSPSPTPEAKQPILTTRVNLGRSHSDMPESASGDGIIKLMSADPYMGDDAKIASLDYDFNLRGLEAEREYSILICTVKEGGDCIELSTIKTDRAGNASYSGKSGITITRDRPFKAIKVTQRNGGFCSNSGSPCLRGELSLEIQF